MQCRKWFEHQKNHFPLTLGLPGVQDEGRYLALLLDPRLGPPATRIREMWIPPDALKPRYSIIPAWILAEKQPCADLIPAGSTAKMVAKWPSERRETLPRSQDPQ